MPIDSRSARPRRSLLLVSPMQPEDFAASLATGADIVCIDLEVGYIAARPAVARANLAAMLAGREAGNGQQIFVRINSARTAEGLRDLVAILDGSLPVDGLMCPKIGKAAEVQAIDDVLCDAGRANVELGAIIETAEGLENAREIARASPRLTWLAFGGYDLSAALGTAMAWQPLLYARARTAHAAALGGIDSLDCPSSGDEAALARDLEAARDLGFTGKACKAASHIAPTNRFFTPDAESVKRARTIVAAAEQAGGAVPVVDGKMIEAPTVREMARVLARARSSAA